MSLVASTITVDTAHLEFSSDSGATWSTVQGNVGVEDLTLTGTAAGSTDMLDRRRSGQRFQGREGL